jgi:hypothetical protein
MKAIVRHAYGAPENVLELCDIGKPVIKDDEVPVRVHATPEASQAIRYEQATRTTAASDVALLRIKSGKCRHGTSPAR